MISKNTSIHPVMFSVLCRWLISLFLLCTAVFTSESNNDTCPELWRKSFTMTNEKCPRFMYVQTGIEHGQGDQLERLFLAMSIVFGYPTLNVTLVVDDTFGTRSLNHYPEGYGTIFHEILNFPQEILRYSQVRQRYQLALVRMVSPHHYNHYLTKIHPFNETSFPCYTMFEVDVYDSCQGHWCSYFYTNEIQAILKPILRASFQTCPVKSPVKSPRIPVKSPLDPTVLNIVWHVRSGDVCPHCDNPVYYHTIYQFIIRSLSNRNLTEERGNFTSSQSNFRATQSNFYCPLPHQNIIVHQRYFSPFIPHLFNTLPNVILYTSEDMMTVVETMLYADILVSTGSSLPSTLAWFTQPYQQVLLEDTRSSTSIDPSFTLPCPYLGNGGDSIRIQGGIGLMQDNDEMNETASEYLREHLQQALLRVYNHQQLTYQYNYSYQGEI